jgi:hypothetical protein
VNDDGKENDESEIDDEKENDESENRNASYQLSSPSLRFYSRPFPETMASFDRDSIDLDPALDISFVSRTSKLWQMIGSFLAVDWIVVKATIFSFGRCVFMTQKAFLDAPYIIYPWRNVSDPENSGDVRTRSTELRTDAFTYNPDLISIREYAENVVLPDLPCFAGLVGSDREETIAWGEVKDTFYQFTQNVREDMDSILGEWVPGLSANNRKHWSDVGQAFVGFLLSCLSYVVLLHIWTSQGRKRWWGVIEAYFRTMLICLGIWTTTVADEFGIVKKFEDYKILSGVIYNTDEREDIYTKIENDEKVAFGQYVAAVTLGRIVLLQIVPQLTVVSLILSAVASTPLFVGLFETNDVTAPVLSMKEKLLPLIFFNAYKEAKAMLEADSNYSTARVSFFTIYLFINHSRLIQFLINLYLCFVSIAIIFIPQVLWLLVPILIFILIIQGLLSSIFVVLLFMKLLLRNARSRDETLSGQPEWTVLVQRRLPDM